MSASHESGGEDWEDQNHLNLARYNGDLEEISVPFISPLLRTLYLQKTVISWTENATVTIYEFVLFIENEIIPYTQGIHIPSRNFQSTLVLFDLVRDSYLKL